MRRLLLVLLTLLAGCAPAKMAEPVPVMDELPVLGGVLEADRVLSGDYLLRADLQVPAGVTLTLTPGTRIYVQPSDSTKIDPEYLSREVELLVYGRLLALGSADRPVRIRPLSDDPEAILWSGLELVESTGSRLQHLILEQAETGLLCIDSSPEVEALQVLRSRYGVVLQRRSAPQIVASLIADGEAGLFCWDQSAPRLVGSRIIRQEEEGIYLGRECRPELIDNLVEGTDRALVAPQGYRIDASNRLSSNRLSQVAYPQEAPQ